MRRHESVPLEASKPSAPLFAHDDAACIQQGEPIAGKGAPSLSARVSQVGEADSGHNKEPKEQLLWAAHLQCWHQRQQ